MVMGSARQGIDSAVYLATDGSEMDPVEGSTGEASSRAIYKAVLSSCGEWSFQVRYQAVGIRKH